MSGGIWYSGWNARASERERMRASIREVAMEKEEIGAVPDTHIVLPVVMGIRETIVGDVYGEYTHAIRRTQEKTG